MYISHVSHREPLNKSLIVKRLPLRKWLRVCANAFGAARSETVLFPVVKHPVDDYSARDYLENC